MGDSVPSTRGRSVGRLNGYKTQKQGGAAPFREFRKTDQKYSGSYETSVLKRFADFAVPEEFSVDVEKLFTLIVLTCALRNGDARLKNFGIVYDKVQEQARLAPIYDVVTTTVYMAKDNMALTLNGTTRWPAAQALQRVGETRPQSTPSRIKMLFEQIAEALSDTAEELRKYVTEHPEFKDVGEAMLQEWETGRDLSLKVGNPTPVAVPDLRH